jgi:hypothetical protein
MQNDASVRIRVHSQSQTGEREREREREHNRSFLFYCFLAGESTTDMKRPTHLVQQDLRKTITI